MLCQFEPLSIPVPRSFFHHISYTCLQPHRRDVQLPKLNICSSPLVHFAGTLATLSFSRPPLLSSPLSDASSRESNLCPNSLPSWLYGRRAQRSQGDSDGRSRVPSGSYLRFQNTWAELWNHDRLDGKRSELLGRRIRLVRYCSCSKMAGPHSGAVAGSSGLSLYLHPFLVSRRKREDAINLVDHFTTTIEDGGDSFKVYASIAGRTRDT
jgi:hypothetical protein